MWKVAKTEMPAEPSELKGEALIEWKRLEPFLVSLGRVSRLDVEPLTAYCIAWGRFANIMRNHFAEDNARLTADGPTCEVQHPLIQELLGYAREMLETAGQFGLTARSRDLDGDDPRKIPSVLKRLYGNRRKVAMGSLPESVIPMLPEWDEDDIRPPLWMGDRATQIYYDTVEQLRHVDLFTPVDRIHICALACIGDLFKRADEMLTDDFVPVVSKMTGETTYEKAHPLHRTIRDMMKMAREYWLAYGMSPRARRIFDGEQKTEAKIRPVIFRGASG
jgi:phage terminase small subunit